MRFGPQITRYGATVTFIIDPPFSVFKVMSAV